MLAEAKISKGDTSSAASCSNKLQMRRCVCGVKTCPKHYAGALTPAAQPLLLLPAPPPPPPTTATTATTSLRLTHYNC